MKDASLMVDLLSPGIWIWTTVIILLVLFIVHERRSYIEQKVYRRMARRASASKDADCLFNIDWTDSAHENGKPPNENEPEISEVDSE